MALASPPDFRLSSTQTAIAIIVPSHLQSEINTLRKVHDKAYRKWEPHINIFYPFVDASLLSSAVGAIRASLSSNPIPPFKIRIDDIGTFEQTRNATVFLKPGDESEEDICGLRKKLVAALGRSEGEGTRDGIFRPHLTVGQASLIGPTKERLVEKMKKIIGLEWKVERLAVLRRGVSGEMNVVEEISLQVEGGEETQCQFASTVWRSCYHSETCIKWTQESGNNSASSDSCTEPTKLAIASYNLMSEPNAPQFLHRISHIVEAISKSVLSTTSSTRVLCLQEVNQEMLPLLLLDSKLQTLFPFSTHSPSSPLPSKRNQITLSNVPFSYYSFQFKEHHKSALILSFQNKSIHVANVHLTRALTNDAVATKKSQMEILTKYLLELQSSNEKHIFVAGDFNLTSSSKTFETAIARGIVTQKTAQSAREVIDTEVWNDAFIAYGEWKDRVDSIDQCEGEKGATFDRLRNPLASMSKTVIDDRPQRYDRILFNREMQVVTLTFEIFGYPSEDGTCLSDHYGICATFQIGAIGDTSARTVTNELPSGYFKAIEDSTDIHYLIEPHLPTAATRQLREQAVNLLQQTLSKNAILADVIVVPLGSYAMDTYFTDSDVDVLVIASISPQLFFNAATDQLRALGPEGEESFKGIHLVNSLVSIIEVNILGIKFDVQYCQAAELVKQYHTVTPHIPLQNSTFDTPLLSALSPNSLRPLNTYRSTIYLLTTLPCLDSYRLAHRFLALYLKNHGLYSAKFGFLGGIHLSLLLNRVIKLIPRTTSKSLKPATIVRTFFEYYSVFRWAQDVVCDPELEPKKGQRVDRKAREAIVIQALHLPVARPNVAASCTRLSAIAISSEFALAKEKLERGEWEACLGSHKDCVTEFLTSYGVYVRIGIEAWDEFEVGGEKIREAVGAVESRIVRLMVELGRINGLEGRAWPERFRDDDGNMKAGEGGWKGWYLVGVKAQAESDERKKEISGKVAIVVREFEESLRQVKELKENEVWVTGDVISKKKLASSILLVDEN